MSFRTRLTSFFVLFVIVPMVAIGVLGFRLISDSEQGKADATYVHDVSKAGSVVTIHDGSPYAQQLQQVFADNFNHALQLDITAGRSNHNLKFTSFDHPLVISVRKIQHITGMAKLTAAFCLGCKVTRLKAFSSFTGRTSEAYGSWT